MTTLMHANHQWAARPADERFPSLDALHAAVSHSREVAVEAPSVRLNALAVDVDGTDVRLRGTTGQSAGFTHWSFGQLAREVGAPAGYLRDLPANLTVQNLNHGLQNAEGKACKLLFQQNGDLTLLASTGENYKRIWHNDITSRLMVLRSNGWNEAPAAFDGSRGMYAGDEDMFAFMVDNDRRIFESLPGGGLSRGFFVWNSTVGASSFGIMTFLYNYVCGNHMVWGAQGVKELRIRHVGNADAAVFGELEAQLTEYANASESETVGQITRAQRMLLGDDKEKVLDAVFGLRITGLTRSLIGQAFDKATERTDWYGDPRSVWGLTNGMTEIARDLPNANDRTALDRMAGKIAVISF